MKETTFHSNRRLLNMLLHENRPLSRRADRSRTGFTLVELLAALLVVALMTGLISVGVSMAMRTYRESTFQSQAQMLYSTLDRALSDPLHFATVQIDSTSNTWDYKVIYQNNDIRQAEVVVHQIEGIGTLAFRSKSDPATYYDLLNTGSYTDCTITDVEYRFSPSPAQANTPPASMTVTYTIASTLDASLSKTYTTTYRTLNAQKS